MVEKGRESKDFFRKKGKKKKKRCLLPMERRGGPENELTEGK